MTIELPKVLQAAGRRMLQLPTYILELVTSGNWRVATNGVREILRRDGWLGVRQRLVEILDDRHQYLFPDYPDWIASEEKRLPISRGTTIPDKPALISVLLPTYDPDPRHLTEAIESVRQQSFPRWELCIADDHSTDPRIPSMLAEYARKDERIHVLLREENGHISAASNSALALAKGDYIALLDHDDILPGDALLAVAHEIAAHPNACIVYSDEDKITPGGQRFGPVFKPDWDPDAMLQRNFVSHLGVFRTAAVRAVGGFREGFEGSQDWDLTLRVAENCRAEDIRHIPRILYHWRAIAGSTALHLNEKNYAVEAGLRAVEEHVRRRQLPVKCVRSPNDPFWSLRAQSPARPRVSLLVGPGLADATLDDAAASLRETTDYPDCEFLIAAGAAETPTSRRLGPGLAKATGEVLCFISPTLQPEAGDWLHELVSHALRPDVGAVGARLLTDDRHIGHAGYRIDADGTVYPLYAGALQYHRGYMDGPRLVQTLAAVGGGCLVVSRQKFLDAGGFNHPDLSGMLADVDLCLRLSSMGLRSVWIPHATLHMQDAIGSRAFHEQVSEMPRLWGQRPATDPAANINLALDNNFPCLRYSSGDDAIHNRTAEL